MTQSNPSPQENLAAVQVDPALGGKRTNYRWVVCGLLFLATTVNYVDRQVFALLSPDLTEEFGWTEKQFSFIVSAFTAAYAIGYSLGGRLMDRIGERKGFGLVVFIWSLAAVAHGLVEPLVHSGLPWWNAAFAGSFLGGITPAIMSVAGFSLARVGLGLAEGGNFPGAVRTVGLWHPKSERALSTGLFNSGSNVGIIVAAVSVPFIVKTMHWGWAAAFYLTGSLGFLWMLLWFLMYRRPEEQPRVSPAELAHIRSDPPDPPMIKLPWLSLLKHRQTWAFVVGMFMTGPIWWFYMYWLPKFLKLNYGIDLNHVLLPLATVYIMADVGSIGGGWLSSWLIRRHYSVNAARKLAFLACAVCVVPVTFAARVEGMWSAVLLIGLAASAHQGYSANLYTIVSDTVPRSAVSSVVGIGGTAACVGGILFSMMVGVILDWTEQAYGQKDYLVPFVIGGCAYLTATLIIHLLLPKLEPMQIEGQTAFPTITPDANL